MDIYGGLRLCKVGVLNQQRCKKDVHVTDYYDNNPLICKFKIFNKNYISVNIEKKFGVIQVINGDPHILQILKTNTIFEMNKSTNNSENIDNKGVFYTVIEIKKNDTSNNNIKQQHIYI